MKDVDRDFISLASPEERLPYEESTSSSQAHPALTRLPTDRKRYPVLSQDEVNQLAARIAQGEEAALEKMVRHNLGLVYSVARRYLGRGLEFNDLVQEGTIGVMIAAQKYDPAEGASFSTYATYWIRQKISYAVMQQGHTIRLPYGLEVRVSKVLFTQERLLAEGKTPTQQVIASETGMTEKQVAKTMRILHDRSVISLSQPIQNHKGSDDLTVGDSVSDPNSIEPSLVIEARKELEEISRKVARLIHWIRHEMKVTVNRADVFIFFYGLDADRQRRTLDETGRIFSITRERVRQIKASIWTRVPKHLFTEAAFEKALAGIPYLEEIAQGEFSWSDVSLGDSTSVLSVTDQLQIVQAKLDMVQATARERLSSQEYELFCYRYGLGSAHGMKSYKQVGEYFGIKLPTAVARSASIWERLSPYKRHFDRKKVENWVRTLMFLREKARS